MDVQLMFVDLQCFDFYFLCFRLNLFLPNFQNFLGVKLVFDLNYCVMIAIQIHLFLLESTCLAFTELFTLFQTQLSILKYLLSDLLLFIIISQLKRINQSFYKVLILPLKSLPYLKNMMWSYMPIQSGAFLLRIIYDSDFTFPEQIDFLE